MDRPRHSAAALAACLALLAAAPFPSGCAPDRPVILKQARILMGTLVEISIVGDERSAPDHFEAAFRELSRLDGEFGSQGQRGEVWKLNGGGWPDGVPVGEELSGLLERAREVGLRSGGAFDVTIGAVSRLWSFEGEGRIPDRTEVETALAAVGWDGLKLDPGAGRVTFARPGMRLDLGGVAKGYAVDRARELLEKRGVAAGIVNAGGDLAAWGERPADGRPWRIGIQDPRDPSALLGTLTLTGRAVVTSGDYERFFMRDGRRYHHILDPVTGYPARGLAGVTVVAGRAEVADAWATALVVMGPDRARRTLEGQAALQGILVDEDGAVWVSAGLKDVWQPR